MFLEEKERNSQRDRMRKRRKYDFDFFSEPKEKVIGGPTGGAR